VLAYAMNHSGNTTAVRPPLYTPALTLCWNKNRSVKTNTALLSASNIHVLGTLVVSLCIQTRKQTHIINLFNYQLDAQFLYSVIYVLYEIPQHVSSNTMLIFRRSKLYFYSIWFTARPLTESDDTRCCKNTILSS
jgi:hypothetical protein